MSRARRGQLPPLAPSADAHASTPDAKANNLITTTKTCNDIMGHVFNLWRVLELKCLVVFKFQEQRHSVQKPAARLTTERGVRTKHQNDFLCCRELGRGEFGIWKQYMTTCQTCFSKWLRELALVFSVE